MQSIPSQYLDALAGGALIGLACSLLLLLNGRIAGISGIVAGLLHRPDARFATDAAFTIGLMLGPVVYLLLFGDWPPTHIAASWPLLMIAGLLVGFGTRMGSGCTSGHGVMGLARLSPRSMVAVVTFLGLAVLTVWLMRLVGVA